MSKRRSVTVRVSYRFPIELSDHVADVMKATGWKESRVVVWLASWGLELLRSDRVPPERSLMRTPYLAAVAMHNAKLKGEELVREVRRKFSVKSTASSKSEREKTKRSAEVLSA